MALVCRLARNSEHDALERMVIDSFEPVTWFCRVDREFGPLNGYDWRSRWQARMRAVFASQIVLVGEAEGRVVAFASGTIDSQTRLAYVDLLAVDRGSQRMGHGREMLRGMLRYLREQGAEHACLDCLDNNQAGNALYRQQGFTEVARHVRWFIRIPDSTGE